MAIDRNAPDIEKSEQRVLNTSYDKKYDVLAFLPLAENAAGTAVMRQKQQLVAGADYDYLDVQQTSGTVETFVFKTGGSGGTTVRTIVVTYTDTSKSDIDTVAWS